MRDSPCQRSRMSRPMKPPVTSHRARRFAEGVLKTPPKSGLQGLGLRVQGLGFTV